MSRLSQLDLTQSVSKKEYEDRLVKIQLDLLGLQRKVVDKGLAVMIGFEGWDAAGKGGAIKRLTERLDPRGIRVYSISKPTEEELAHNYLWRFWTRLPSKGQIAIFDRTWYGRVLVERVENLTPDNRWRQAYQEINGFEKTLVNDGVVLLKFWLQISSKEQKQRFDDRTEDPFKRWKITDEDWRNRKKWNQYEKAIEDMLKKCSPNYAPWTLVEAEDKRFARLKVMETVITALKKA